MLVIMMQLRLWHLSVSSEAAILFIKVCNFYADVSINDWYGTYYGMLGRINGMLGMLKNIKIVPKILKKIKIKKARFWFLSWK